MLIDFMSRHLAIASREGAEKMTQMDPGFWHVISVREPESPRAILRKAKSVLHVGFDDVESNETKQLGFRPMKDDDWAQIFAFVDRTAPGGLLVHCKMGISRSSAVATVILMRALRGEEDVPKRVVDALLSIRPLACPNQLVLRLGLETWMDPDAAESVCKAILADPRIRMNRANQ